MFITTLTYHYKIIITLKEGVEMLSLTISSKASLCISHNVSDCSEAYHQSYFRTRIRNKKDKVS